MDTVAFTTNFAVSSITAFTGRRVGAAKSTTDLSSRPRMSAADKYMSRVVTREAKEAATTTGVYTVQCTEGTAGSNVAEASRLAALAANYRLRQSSQSARYADLYATRRAAIVLAAGSHVGESYAVAFPARAAAGVLGRAEALRACSRYFPPSSPAEEYHFRCVDRQYKATRVPGGVYSTACADGRVSGDAENARVSALAAEYRSRQFSKLDKAAMRYAAIKEATVLARGCSYEEESFEKFPKMSAAMRYSTGAYAASVTETQLVTGGSALTISDQVNGVNLDSYWPSNEIRPAVKRVSPWYKPSPIKNYAPMSEAAVAYGVEAQKAFVDDKYSGWSSGWKPKSTCLPN